MPERVQLRRSKGWRIPPNTVKVDRTTRWGNPFGPPYMHAELAVEMFQDAVYGFFSPGRLSHLTESDFHAVHGKFQAWLKRLGGYPAEMIASELRGKNLACWCKPGAPCHASVLLEIANRKEPDE